MQRAIDYLEAELDSLQDAYKSTKGTDKHDQYGIWVEEVENAIKLLKASERTNTNETSDKHETKQLNILGVMHRFSKNDVDGAYLLGVFNVVGIDGLQKEIERLKQLKVNPYQIIDSIHSNGA